MPAGRQQDARARTCVPPSDRSATTRPSSVELSGELVRATHRARARAAPRRRSAGRRLAPSPTMRPVLGPSSPKPLAQRERGGPVALRPQDRIGAPSASNDDARAPVRRAARPARSCRPPGRSESSTAKPASLEHPHPPRRHVLGDVRRLGRGRTASGSGVAPRKSPPGRRTRAASASTALGCGDVLEQVERAHHVEARVGEREALGVRHAASRPAAAGGGVSADLRERVAAHVDADRAKPAAARLGDEETVGAAEVEPARAGAEPPSRGPGPSSAARSRAHWS